jgi:peptide deformylase
MVLPVFAYGHPVLRKIAKDVEKDDKDLKGFIEDLFETMNYSDGVGLAAPQVGKSIRVFVIDASPMAEDDPTLEDFKKIFINAKIVEENGDKWTFNEGCLSIPGIREDVDRHPEIRIQYYDENWEYHDEKYDGIKARIIQHEYDHLDGVLFPDRLAPLKKRLLKARLTAITKGNVDINYKMKFA